MAFSFDRSLRVSKLLNKELAGLLQFKSKDPRFRCVTITRIKVSRDLSFAKVWIVLSSDNKHLDLIAALNKAVPYFRCLLADSIQLRRIPDLLFIYDEEFVSEQRVFDLIDQLNQDLKENQ